MLQPSPRAQRLPPLFTAAVAIICSAGGVGTAFRVYSTARHGNWSLAWADTVAGAPQTSSNKTSPRLSRSTAGSARTAADARVRS